ncbi:hypothetical protein [Geodermatophilus sp. URMC 63]
MGLSFRNDTPDRMSLAFLRWDPNCPGGDEGQPFSGHGWYTIEPGQTREVWHGDAGDWHRWWGYFARTVAGRFWAGDYGMNVPIHAFSRCYREGVGGASSEFEHIGFRGLLMDDDYDDFVQPLSY